MALNKAGETIFSGVSNTTIQQLLQREEYFSRKRKTITDLSVLNQNAGWVKVSSGSNILSRDGLKTYSGPAQRFILHGGSTMSQAQADINNFGTIRQGINFQKGTSFEKSQNAYNNYANVDENEDYGLGIRPMPGITSFSLQTYNPYGTLRQADVTFTVWTLDDLQLAEKLYLRPGFTCVIEFGHSLFVNNSGELEKFGNGTKSALSENFLFSAQKIEAVEKKIEEKRIECEGNYDGFFGYVSNFSYSYRLDGGFDCSMKVVSKGVILDSIKGGATSSSAKITKTVDPIETSAPKHKSIFHTIFQAITDFVPSTTEENKQYTLNDILLECAENGEQIEFFTDLDTLDQCKFIYANLTSNVGGADDSGTVALSTQRLSYIPLRFVLDMFNKYASIYEVSDKNRRNPIISFALEFGNKFRTYDEHFSVSPSNVHLPKAAPVIKQPQGSASYGMTAFGADVQMQEYAMSESNRSDENGKNEILNIFISTKTLLTLADKVYDKNNVDSDTFIDFLNALLKTINTALSDVCKLSLYYNETINKYEVVDLHGVGKVAKIPTINISGLKSTVEEISIQSRLSTATAAQISIAAQGTIDDYKDNVRAIRSWNAGSVDRFVPTKTGNPNNTKAADEKAAEELRRRKAKGEEEDTTIYPYGGSITKFFEANEDLAQRIYKFFEKIKGTEGKGPEFDAQTELDLQLQLRKINLTFYEIAQANKKGNKGVRHEIPIPVELSITMKGISGMKIGQVFKVNKGVLLPKYDKYGYVITGLEQKVDTQNKWTTEITTQFFELDNL